MLVIFVRFFNCFLIDIKGLFSYFDVICIRKLNKF